MDRNALEALVYEIVPAELKQLRQWVCYRIEQRNGLPTKIPYRIDKVGRNNAKTNDPGTWHTFDEVIDSLNRPKNKFNGVGFILSESDPYVFIDLDHVVDDGVIQPWAQELIDKVGSYTEFSLSGTGIHIIARAGKPGSRCRTHMQPQFEIYDNRRLVVFTGRLIPKSAPEIRDADEAVTVVYRSVFGDEPDNALPPKETTKNARPNDKSDTVLVRDALAASNGDKFRRLWNGDIGDYGGDRSSADMALCCMLAYWADKDPSRMDRLFRDSGLMRAKWDEQHGAQTYGQMTVERANAKVKITHSDHVASGGKRKSRSKAVSADSEVPRGPDGDPMNDLGNARRLVKKHGEVIRFCHDAGKWFCWDGRRWVKDDTGEIVRKAKTVVDDMLRESAALWKAAVSSSDDAALDAAKAFERHAVSSGNHRRILAMISQAESEPGANIVADDLDSDPWLFNCGNGTIDLHTGEIHPHKQADLISKITKVEYHPDAQCPTWERFIREVFQEDRSTIQFVQQACGYSLTGDTREHVFFILHGCGSNGKSTFLGVLRDVLADYHTKTSTDTFIEKQGSNNSNDVAALRGARMVSAIETSAGKKLAEALIKEVTGQDAVTARFLYQEYFTFIPVFKIWLACNHAPVIQNQDDGMWRRVRLVPFAVQFHDKDHPTGPYKDKALAEKLTAEHEGILAWLVRGCLDWQKEGLFIPDPVRAATGALREDMDLLDGFLSECCISNPTARATAKGLYSSYTAWAEANGEKALSQRWFGIKLAERGRYAKFRGANGIRCWTGIGLIDAESGETVTHVTDTTLFSQKLPCVCAREEECTSNSSIGTSAKPVSLASLASPADGAGERTPPSNACSNCSTKDWEEDPNKPGRWACRKCGHAVRIV